VPQRDLDHTGQVSCPSRADHDAIENGVIRGAASNDAGQGCCDCLGTPPQRVMKALLSLESSNRLKVASGCLVISTMMLLPLSLLA
jgi:hypothetical protein